MPVTYLRDDERRRVLITVSGTITTADLMAALAHQVTDGTWSWPTIYDGSDRTGILSADQVRAIAGQGDMLAAVHGKRGPVAFVRKTAVGYGTARMLAMLSEDQAPGASAFEDLAAAEAWLEQVTAAASRSR